MAANRFGKNIASSLKREPKKVLLVLVILVLVGGVLFMNRAELSKLFGASPAKKGNASVGAIVKLNQSIAEREVLFKRLERLQKRGGSFMLIDPNGAGVVGIKVQDEVRRIAEKSRFNIANTNQPRFSKLSEKIETCEVPISGSSTWGELLNFLSEIEMSLPNFVWSSFALTTREKDENIYFNGSLKIVLVRDAAFADVLKPIHERLRGAKPKVDPEGSLRHNAGIQRIGESLSRTADSARTVTDSALAVSEEEEGDYADESDDGSDADFDSEGEDV